LRSQILPRDKNRQVGHWAPINVAAAFLTHAVRIECVSREKRPFGMNTQLSTSIMTLGRKRPFLARVIICILQSAPSSLLHTTPFEFHGNTVCFFFQIRTDVTRACPAAGLSLECSLVVPSVPTRCIVCNFPGPPSLWII